MDTRIPTAAILNIRLHSYTASLFLQEDNCQKICLRSPDILVQTGFSPSAPFSCPPFSVPFVPGRSNVFTCISISIVPTPLVAAYQTSIISCGIPVSARYFVSSSHIPARLVPLPFVSLLAQRKRAYIYTVPALRSLHAETLPKHLSGITDLTSDPKISFQISHLSVTLFLFLQISQHSQPPPARMTMTALIPFIISPFPSFLV